ncbi:MAG: hypothetical protein ACYCW6_32585, partial [Candidatus Xenobia bacterium]
NYYADHPCFAGEEWEGKFHFRNTDQLRDGSALGFAPYTSALRWGRKPVVLREWGTVWPNAYRAVSIPEAVAYASLQDYDGLLLFCYKTGEYRDRLMFFGYEADPTVWGLFGLGAQVFLRGDVHRADRQVTFVHDNAALFDFPDGVTDAFRLAWLVRLASDVQDTPPAMTASLAMAAGAHVQVAAAPQTLVQLMSNLGWSQDAIDQVVQTGVYTSGTGQITLDTHNGRLFIATASTCSISGELLSDAPLSAGLLTVQSVSPIGSVMAVSLDGRPLNRSTHYVVKMVTQAHNTDQNLVPLTAPGVVPPDNVLQDEGHAPVLTDGAPAQGVTTVSVAGRELVSIALQNGTWELVVNHHAAKFLCDTPGLAATICGQPLVTSGVPQTVHGILR